MKRVRELFFGLLCLLFTVNLHAQHAIPDFGDIPGEHLEINSFQGDSSLGAIVLFDKGEVYFDNDLNVVFERHKRLKILSEKGYDWATVTIPYYVEDRRQSVGKLKAVSYNVMPNGKIESSKVGRRDYFEEKVSEDWEQVKFTFPAIEPGTIIEYRYRLESESIADVPDWTFQHEIPTLISSYKADVPEWYRYMFYYQGVESLDEKNQDRYQDTKFIAFNRSSTRGTRNIRVNYEATEYSWVMRDIPALTEEPYMSSLKNYRSKLFVQLASIQYPNSMYEPVLSDWSTVAEELRDHDNFGEKLKGSRQLEEITPEVISDAETEAEKMRLIYDYVTNSIKWNDEYGFLAERSPDEVLTQKTGTGVEINLLLVEMLREAGIEANPVLLSTRDNGKLLTIYPIMVQFNHVICEATIGEERYYMDAKSDLRPYNLLPVENLNGQALVVTENSFRWADLQETATSEETYHIRARLHKDATVSGELQSNISGYPALNVRASLEEEEEKNDEEILKEHLFEGYSDINLDSISVKNRTEYEKSLSIMSKFTIGDAIRSSNQQYYYFNPMLILREESNPFKLEKRKYPVVFPSSFSKRVIVNLFLPEGMTVEELPESKLIRLQQKSGMFRRVVQKSRENSITMLYDIRFDKHIFQPEEYEYLKLFWQDLVTTHSEFIVLKNTEGNEPNK